MSETNRVNSITPITVGTGTATEIATQGESKEPLSYLIGFLFEGMMFESIVSDRGHFQFAYLENSKVEKVLEVTATNERIRPPHILKKLWECKALHLPSDVWAHSIPTAKLLEEIKTFITRYFDAPAEWLEPIALYILMTWVYDRFTAVPYLRFLGEPQTGKTRLLQVVASLCFRSLCIAGNVTGAALYRSIDLTRGTLAVDESDFRQSEAWNDVIKVFNCGYSRGLVVIRNERVGNDYQPTGFDAFGPKIISTRHRFDDPATESRCITFETRRRELPKHIRLQIPLQFFQESIILRNKLLRWRFDNYANVEAREDEMRRIHPRLGQIGASLAAVAPDGDVRNRLVSFLDTYDRSVGEESDETIVAQAMGKIRNEWPIEQKQTTVGQIAGAASEISMSLGKGTMTAKAVGSILRGAFGMKPRRTNAGWVVDIPDLLEGERSGERVNVAPGSRSDE